ncbi:MAG: hypothetical protein KAR05_05770 [Candidatus Omnitrophica bacterium]|nr:hypothetical protein [Candidatus Omnitrophota bacterium]
MKKKNKILGIAIIVMGAVLSFINMGSGITTYAGGIYSDLESFNVVLAPRYKGKSDIMYLNGPQIISVWLKMPNRKIENKNITVSVYLMTDDGVRYTTHEKGFNSGYIRNSAGEGQYYKIGDYRLDEPIKGSVHYEVSGSWTTSQPADLVVRRQEASKVPFENKLAFLGGAFILGSGIWLLTYKKGEN